MALSVYIWRENGPGQGAVRARGSGQAEDVVRVDVAQVRQWPRWPSTLNYLGNDVAAFSEAIDRRIGDGRDVLAQLLENANWPGTKFLCQDTGLAVVFLEVGQEVHWWRHLEDAVNEGVSKGRTTLSAQVGVADHRRP
jgi:hypothetical protein